MRHASPSSTTSPSSGGTPRVDARRLAVLAVLGTAALVLAACGGGTSAASNTTATTAPTTRPTTPPGAFGTIASLSGQSMEVQSAASSTSGSAGGQTTVNYTSTTTFNQTVAATLANVTVGSCVSAFNTSGFRAGASSTTTTAPGTPLNASTVLITVPTNGACTGGLGGFAGGAGAGGGFGGRPGGGTGTRPTTPGGGTRPRTGAGAGGFGASGSVTSVSGSTIVVNATNPTTKTVTAKTVDVSATTAYTQTEGAAATDLAVGKCVQAIGPADDTGAVTATSIAISSPGPNGCTGGFRGGAGRFGGGSGTGTTGA